MSYLKLITHVNAAKEDNMSILEGLSAVCGEKPKIANRAVAEKCIENPIYMDEIRDNIGNKNLKIAADCAEVMTFIAEEKPELVTSQAETLFNHLNHKKSNVRWECAHALALTSHTIGEVICERLDYISDLIEKDDSIVVRDYAVDILAGFANIGEEEAHKVYPYIKKALVAHDSRHAGHAIDGFINVVSKTDVYDSEVLNLIEPYKNAEKKALVTKANKLSKLILKKQK